MTKNRDQNAIRTLEAREVVFAGARLPVSKIISGKRLSNHFKSLSQPQETYVILANVNVFHKFQNSLQKTELNGKSVKLEAFTL